ncbi:phosphodiester glycosidase family protein [Pedobacter hiemivivus]|uniref:Phosphodiester glycosidase family protein n=2 Tax=Pedobacter hiemivivus TaxID=2530454 RepID=A0A4R0MV78_9SPHI|nr:phosphodiester glycosidase family protein [Pedobacter hiemivivus]
MGLQDRLQMDGQYVLKNNKMKKHWLWVILIGFVAGCSGKKLLTNNNPIHEILLDKTGWTIDTLRNDVIWYKFSSATDKQFAYQNVNVICFNPKAKSGQMVFDYKKEKDSLSVFAGRIPGAIAGINATYFLEKKDSADYMHLRLKGKDLQQVKIPKTSIYWWKHQGMFSFNDEGTAFDIRFSPENFGTVKSANIMTGAPMLIDNFNPVGLKFADTTGMGSKVNKLHYEHYLRHQGVRHPRTAIAVTKKGYLLLITVDGRNKIAKGMSAKELTEFLRRYFNPKSVMNIDGGGSTMMWVKGQPYNGIVNYPTDNKKFDHYGQRMVETAIIIK